MRKAFILCPFCIKEEAAPSLTGMRGIGVGNILCFLITKIRREVLVLKSAIAEPEVFLSRNEASVEPTDGLASRMNYRES